MRNNSNYNGWAISTIFLLGVIAFLAGFSGSISKVLMFDPLRSCIISLIFAVIILLLQLPLLLNNCIEKRGKTK